MPDQEEQEPLALDTSVLLNFVNVRRIDLLGKLDRQVVVPGEVLEEVTRPQQRRAVVDAVRADVLQVEHLTDPEELALFADLQDSGRLGAGECSVLALAGSRGWPAVIQDRKARAVGRDRFPEIEIWQTEDATRYRPLSECVSQ